MTYTLQIQSATKEYAIKIEDTFIFIDNIKQGETTFFVVDRNVYHLYTFLFEDIPEDRIFIIDSLEENKTIDTVLKICEKMMVLTSRRNTNLVSIGGGIVQDITGFVANILYRGISWTFVPTTLLAACDSCIGGKTSLNYKSYKNLIGTFYPPDKIYICPELFKTLTQRDLFSGLGEVVKFNIMAGDKRLSDLEQGFLQLINSDINMMKSFVLSSLEFKKKFIEADEFDTGERIKLNFAHTFGHALEVASEYLIPHGTAVALGVVVANCISVNRDMMSDIHAKRIEELIRQIIIIDVKDYIFDLDIILSIIHKDKKQIDSQITAVLLHQNYELSVVNDVSVGEIGKAFNCLAAFIQTIQ